MSAFAEAGSRGRLPPMPSRHRPALIAAGQRSVLTVHAAVSAANNGASFRHHVVTVPAAMRAPRRHLRNSDVETCRYQHGGGGAP